MKKYKKRFFVVSKTGVYTPFNKRSTALKDIKGSKLKGLRLVKRSKKGLVKQKPFNYYKKIK